MARGVPVAALLQLAAVRSLAVAVQYAPGEGDGLTSNATTARDGGASASRFTVRIKVPRGRSASKEPQAKLMGWQLGSEEGSPIRVVKIRGQGLVARHNADGGERPIAAGDELVGVNGVEWNGDNRAFEALLGKEIQAATKARERAPPLRLALQRRRAQAGQQGPGALEGRGARGEGASAPAGARAGSASGPERDPFEEARWGRPPGAAGAREAGGAGRAGGAAGAAGARVDRAVSNVEGLIAAWNRLHPEDLIEVDREAFHRAMATSLVAHGHGERPRSGAPGPPAAGERASRAALL